MSNILLLNQPTVGVGLQVYTATIPSAGLYSARVQCSVPQAVPTGSGAGSGSGLGAGAGGGTLSGFAIGGGGLGKGAVGQGFGPALDGYQQPPVDIKSNPQGAGVASALVVTVVNTTTSTTLYTSTSFATSQDGLKFNVTFPAAASDVITITYSSANASDSALNGVKSITTIQQGF